MRLFKPAWINHDGKPIFSIDIHPDGSRFATGGQGEDSGKVAIWNMGPVKDEAEEKDDNIPKLLCLMDNHLACVNCVRWSNNGKSLASAGDDKLVMIWQHTRYAGGSSMFGSGTRNVEQWRPASTLRGHSGDILDLAWSGNDAWLATCSVDNTIVVWNAEKFPEQVAVLKGHKGLVKGVTWDPVGRYLASQSDDRSLRVWRTRDWQEESVITEPFHECSGTTHVLRLNWSPDGNYIVSAHAMNNTGPVAQIVERDGWKATLDFVGHRKAITVVRFNPNIFSKKFKKSPDQTQQYTCCAIGSRDRSLSIWLTSLKRPLVVTHDLFDNSILDISWSRNGMELLACSCDGSVAYIAFTPEEIGSVLSQNEMQMFLETRYGRCLVTKNSSGTASQIIESTAMLKLQQQKKETEVNGVAPRKEMHDKANDNSMVPNGAGGPFKPRDKQIETKTPDGRRRITPIFLAPQPDVNVSEIPMPFTSSCNSNNSSIKFTTSKDHSKIVVEKKNIVTKPGFGSPSSKSNLTNSLSSPPAGSFQRNSGNEATPKSSTPGEKDTEALKSPKLPSTINTTIQPMAALKQKKPDSTTKEKPEKEKPKTLVSTPERPEKDRMKDRMKHQQGLKRKHEGGHGVRGRPRKYDKDRQLLPGASASAVMAAGTPSHTEKETIRYVSGTSDLKLPVPNFEKSFHKIIYGKIGEENSLVLEVENDVAMGTHKVHKMQCVRGGEKTWEHIHTSRILMVDGSREITCAACEDGVICMYSSCGRKLIPGLMLNSKVSKLSTNGYYTMAVTQKGSLYVWNMQTKAAVIKNESLSSIMSGDETLLRALLTTEGIPIITISSHKSFSFSVDLGCWVLVHNKSDPLQQSSDHHSCAPRSGTRTQGPLASLQSLQDRLGPQAGRMLSTGHTLQQTATLSYLETQLAVCLSLKSGAEYRFWLQTYVRYMVQEGIECKVREVCDEMLGPVYKSKGKSSWESTVLGMDKRELLQEILPHIGANLQLQRLFTEYQEQLDTIDR